MMLKLYDADKNNANRLAREQLWIMHYEIMNCNYKYEIRL